MTITRDEALAMDHADVLAPFRDRFDLPEGRIYLDGNSLGALPRATRPRIDELLAGEWGRNLIAGWNTHDWIGMPQRLGARIAPLVGAGADEVIVCDSTSVNLFKLIAGALTLRPGRRTILSEPGNFPTDLYMAEGLAALRGDIRLRTVAANAIADAVDTDTALVLLTHVHYTSGRMLDMAKLTAAAHAKGALICWDLSHSTGAVELALRACDVDLAVGCGYKYLNGGPGAPSFLFVAERLQASIEQPLTGWFGHAAPFSFEDDYRPAPGLDRFLCGTPSVIALSALECGLDGFDGVDLPLLAAKGRAQTQFLVELIERNCSRHGFTLLSPRDAFERGNHVSFVHPHAFAICQALIARGVVGDFRAPDRLRFGVAALYTRFVDLFDAAAHLEAVMRNEEWTDARFGEKGRVT